jgi:tetratricopeptide (TPR) repeat protein
MWISPRRVNANFVLVITVVTLCASAAGVCYRTLGRVHEAEHQFKLALALNPAYHSAVFNLGLTYQHLNRWSEAIAHFRRVTEVCRMQTSALRSALIVREVTPLLRPCALASKSASQPCCASC